MTVGERELLINQLKTGSLQDLLLIQRAVNQRVLMKLQEEEDR